MYQESAVLKNLAILQRLTKGEAKLEDIAKSAGYRPKPTERSLRLLASQGLVEEKNGIYRLREGVPTTKVSAALELVMPWADFQTESFYEIARFAARTILTQSWSAANVRDVLLYGSTLRSGDALERRKPRDIDFVILHCGNELAEFEESKYDQEYADEPAEPRQDIHDLPSTDPRTRRLNAFNSLLRLGYAEGEDIGNRAVKLIGDRIASLEAGSLSEAEVKSWQNTLRERMDELGAYIDVNGVSNVFDVHVMHTGLLGDEEEVERAAERLYRGAGFEGFEGVERARENTREHYAKQRAQAVKSCVDPTFWHRVFSEGRLYTLATDDFTKTIEDKYPGALKLFEGK